MRRLATAMAAFVVMGLSVPAGAYQMMNLIGNGSFEVRTASVGLPSGWRFSTTEGATCAWSLSPCTGARAIHVARPKVGGETVLDNRIKMVPVTGEVTYRYKFAAKGSGELRVTTGFMKPDNKAAGDKTVTFALSSRYRVFTLNAVAPTGSCRAWIAFGLEGKGAFDIDDVAMISDPGFPQYPDAYANLSFSDWPSARLAEVGRPNDVKACAVLWDKECRRTLGTGEGRYLHMTVSDSYMRPSPSGQKCAVTVEYADKGTDSFQLQYDGAQGAYVSAGVVKKTGTLEWKKKTFYIADARFAKGERHGADFRIDDMVDGPEHISYIAVSHWDSTIRSRARIVDNHLETNGAPTFLKTGTIAADFCNEDLSTAGYPAQLKAKGYTSSRIDAYWFLFDTVGDGSHSSMANIRKFVDDCYSRGLKLGLGFETESVGGPGTPAWMFDTYDCQACNSTGAPITDTEYGTGFKVQSLLSDAYLFRSRDWMTWMLRHVDRSKIMWYETPVEPQYIGIQMIDYSKAAHEKWRLWLAWRYSLAALNKLWGTRYTDYDSIAMPKDPSDPRWSLWLTWRSYALASWVNGDIQTIKNAVGEEALVATDALIVTGMTERIGYPAKFIDQINPNVYQVNWTWWAGKPWDAGYDLCAPIARANNRAISEHMTINNSDFQASDADAVLRHTLERGNKWGWEFVNIRPVSSDSFSLYNNDWSPKPLMQTIDGNNGAYMRLAESYLTRPL